MRTEKNPGLETGFTLLEILIGLVLLSIMMTLIFGSMRMSAQAWNAGEKRAAQFDTMLVVESFLRQYLSTARPVFDDFSGDEAIFSFSGSRDSIQFVSNLPSSSRLGGLHQFNLQLVEEHDSRVLVAKLKPFYPVPDGVESSIEDVRLIDGVENIEWSYYGFEDFQQSEGQWSHEWAGTDSMPVLIQMTVRMKDGNEWPPMIVNPKLVPTKPRQLAPTPPGLPSVGDE